MDSPLPPYNPNPVGGPTFTPPSLVKPPSPKQQSWGAVISIIIIVLMIVVGAFYTWGKRIAEKRALIEETASSTVTY